MRCVSCPGPLIKSGGDEPFCCWRTALISNTLVIIALDAPRRMSAFADGIQGCTARRLDHATLQP